VGIGTETNMSLPIVAIIGRPNVGKSTLLNRILHRRMAITDDSPGVTRDKNAVPFEWNGRTFMLVDTGGFVISSPDLMEQAVSEQSRLAMEESDLVLFLVDSRTGVTDLDAEIGRLIKKSGKPVVLAVNKIDTNNEEQDRFDFYNLGLGEPWPVSGIRGRGSGDLLDVIVENLPPGDEEAEEDDGVVRVACIGRPNVGKSSIVNALTGRTVSLVTNIPGTTRDSVDTRLTVDGREIMLVDTAGLRRQAKFAESIEYYSSLRTFRSLERCDVAIVVLDINEGITSYDKRLVDQVTDAGKGLIMAANKWDLVEKDHTTHKQTEIGIRDELPDKAPYPVIFTSALTGQRVKRLLEESLVIQDRRSSRVQTAELNDFIEHLPLPPGAGNVVIRYATQYTSDPPSFAVFVKDLKQVKQNFKRYMEHRIRDRFDFAGVPIRISFRGK
jgi:GTPase